LTWHLKILLYFRTGTGGSILSYYVATFCAK